MRSFREDWIQLVLAFIWALTPAYGQVISSSIVGTVADSERAVIPGVSVALTNEGTGATITVNSNQLGFFRFPTLLPGTYTLTVKTAGFKTFSQTGIELSASEVRDLGTLVLQVGDVQEEVTVTAVPTPVQVASSEKSSLVSGNQLNQVQLKGRDFLGLMVLVPGVVDTGAVDRQATGTSVLNGIMIHGSRDVFKNYTVDGVTAVDTGSGQWVHFEPNIDTISEVKVLTSNYQAEFGRNAGGTISVITKGGGRDFHGSGWWTHRHDEFNANEFFRNRSGVQKPPYRYNIAGYSIGGPVYIPEHFNSDRSKLFFFFSQEYTRMRVDYGTQYVNMPTQLERKGDFSRSFDTSGKLIVVNDPLTGRAFPGNVIPPSRINPAGQGILNFLPLPNYTDPDPRLVNQQNYRAAASGPHPRRDDMVRIDANPWPGFNVYYRFIENSDCKDMYFNFGIDFLLTPTRQCYPGHGHAVHFTNTFTPTLVNEFTFGKGFDNLWYDMKDPSKVARSLMGNVPRWFPIDKSRPQDERDDIPNVVFGSTPVNPPTIELPPVPYNNWADIYSFSDNVSKVWKNHNLKFGLYVERGGKFQQQSVLDTPAGSTGHRGAFSFARDPNNPFESNNGFANTLLGNFKAYSEATDRLTVDLWYSTVEGFVQDNWRVTPRLTLDLGVRVYHLGPVVDSNYNTAGFDPQSYDPAKAPRLYAPGRDASGRRVAIDPATGQTATVSLIGMYVPGSGDFGNGMRIGGKGGYPSGIIEPPPLAFGPRFGFAYDMFGDGKTAIRGGFGMFYNRMQDASYLNMSGNPPLTYKPTLFYGNLDSMSQAAGVVGPTSIQFLNGNAKLSNTMNFSLGLQRNIGFNTVLDASYVGSLSRHLMWRRNLNAIPMFAHFQSANEDPTSPGKPLPDDFLRPYTGFGDLMFNEFAATSNYNALEVTAQRRLTKGLMFGVAYTWSRALGVGSADADATSPYFSPRARNYGVLSYDRSQMLVINHLYELPNLGQRLRQKWVSAVLDHWSVSGITRFSTGAPVTPGWSTTYSVDTTGSSEAARITVLGDPRLSKGDRTFYQNFKTEAFAPTPVGSFGNAGIGVLRQPGINNWDISIGKKFPIGLGENRTLQFRTELYNAWNHTQFASYDTAARFDASGRQVNANFGAYKSAREPRIIAFALRFEY